MLWHVTKNRAQFLNLFFNFPLLHVPKFGLSPVHDHQPSYLKIWKKKQKKPPLIVTNAVERNLHIVTNVKFFYEKTKEKKRKRRRRQAD
jgi:penicillin-binding protein-related factor A (putative recombinase)